MTTISVSAEQRTILKNISWVTFERLLQETGEDRGYRFAYNQGLLEIITPLYEHENPKIQLDRFVLILAEEVGIEIKSLGSITLKRKGVRKGIEPDNCYYIQNEAKVRRKQEVDLEIDPPPDLAIEIDITSSSINKFDIYAALGVLEIWRYDGKKLQFYQLIEEKYIECEFSLVFPFVSVIEIGKFLEQVNSMGEIALLKIFRCWVKEHRY